MTTKNSGDLSKLNDPSQFDLMFGLPAFSAGEFSCLVASPVGFLLLLFIDRYYSWLFVIVLIRRRAG